MGGLRNVLVFLTAALLVSCHAVPDNSCVEDVTGVAGEFTSPGFPYNYQNNVNCTWVVRVPEGNVVALVFDALDLEPCGWWCHCDSLAVYDGDSLNDEVLGTVCGSTLPNTVVSSSNTMLVRFITDATANRGGFQVHWTSEPPNFNTTAQEEPFFPPDCYQELTGVIGSFASRGYPGDYSDMTHCAWVVRSPEGTVITLTFDTVAIESCGTTCLCDALTIFDGDNDRGRVLCKICGTTNQTVVSTGNAMYVQFLTDMSYTGSGFLVNWTSGAVQSSQTQDILDEDFDFDLYRFVRSTQDRGRLPPPCHDSPHSFGCFFS